MIYFKWAVLCLLTIIAQVLGLIVVPLSNKFGWNKFTWSIWGNDDGSIIDFPDPNDTNRSFRWLAIRNRAHNWSKKCGVLVGKYKHEGDLLVSDWGHPGKWFLTQEDAFEYYLVKRILKWLPWPLCLRIRIGWKLHGMEGKVVPLVCHVSIRKYRYKDYSE